METLTPEQEKRFSEKLDKLFPHRGKINFNDPAYLRQLSVGIATLWVDKIAPLMRKLDQAAMESAALAWQKGIV